MIDANLDVQRERAARNQALCRTINQHIDELNGLLLDREESLPQYICECLDMSCTERIAMPHAEYRQIRRHPTEFIVLDGHQDLQVEEVVHRDTRWIIVRKIGVGATIATELS